MTEKATSQVRALTQSTDYTESFEREVALGRDREAAEAAVGVGNVLEEQGQWVGAKAWYKRALDSVGGIEEPVPERLHAFFNLHVVTRSSGHVSESRTWLQYAEREAERVDPVSAAPFLYPTYLRNMPWVKPITRRRRSWARHLILILMAPLNSALVMCKPPPENRGDGATD